MRVLAFGNCLRFDPSRISNIACWAYIPTKHSMYMSLSFLQNHWGELYNFVPHFSSKDTMLELEIEDCDVYEVVYTDPSTYERIGTPFKGDIYDTTIEAKQANDKALSFNVGGVASDNICGVYKIMNHKRGIDRIKPVSLNEKNHPMLHTSMYVSRSNGQMIRQGDKCIDAISADMQNFRDWFGMDGYDANMFVSQVKCSCNMRTARLLQSIDSNKDDDSILDVLMTDTEV